MKILEQSGHQGDTQWFRIDSIPEEAKKVSEKKFLAASEKSGHAHGLFGNYDMYELEDGFVIDVKDDCILNHCSNTVSTSDMEKPIEVPYKDHKPSYIKKGLYYVGIQRKFNPLEKHWEKVKD